MSRQPNSPPNVRVIRNPPQTRWTRFSCWLQDAWRRTLGLHALWVLVYLAVGTWALMPRLMTPGVAVEPGDIATRDHIATTDILVPDEVTTNDRKRQAREAVLPVYDYDPAIARETDDKLARLFATGRLWLSQGVPLRPEAEDADEGNDVDPVEALVLQLEETSGVRLGAAAYLQLLEEEFVEELEAALRGVAGEAFRRGIVANKELLLEHRARGVTLRNLETQSELVQFNLFDYLGYTDEVRLFLGTQLRAVPSLTANQRNVFLDFLLMNTTPNVFMNRTETLARQDESEAAVPPVVNQIQQGQVIVRKGDRIPEAAARAIVTLQGDSSLGAQAMPLLGNALLLSLGSLVVWLGLGKESYPNKSRSQLFSESIMLLAAMLTLARLGFWMAEGLGGHAFGLAGADTASYIYAIPVASLALVMAMLYGRSMALLVAVVYAVLAARIGGEDSLYFTIYTLAGSLAAIFVLERFQIKHRFALFRVGLIIGLVNVTAIIMVTALFRTERAELEIIGLDLTLGLIGGFLVAATASFGAPILESLFSITTDLRLVELSNTNLPLLRRLAFEAPGSFQHSLMVANLAKSGCSAVEADSTLAYAAGLYHDIGKIFRPEYFIENQHASQNPHDKLSPSMSALVLTSHIKDGLDLARQHRLPRAILDAISQHHGTMLMKFFYQRAIEQGGESVEESEFRYPGPRPQTRVMGILMLADGVEAASRSLHDPTPQTIRAVIRKITEVCIQDGQLDETDLTLSDLKAVSDAFFQVLSNIFHRRVDYPGFDFGDRQRNDEVPPVEPSQAQP